CVSRHVPRSAEPRGIPPHGGPTGYPRRVLLITTLDAWSASGPQFTPADGLAAWATDDASALAVADDAFPQGQVIVVTLDPAPARHPRARGPRPVPSRPVPLRPTRPGRKAPRVAAAPAGR